MLKLRLNLPQLRILWTTAYTFQVLRCRTSRLTLRHPTSMSLTNFVDSRASFAASPLHSLTRISAAKSLAQSISIPILAAAQITQIESEVEEMRSTTSLTPSLYGYFSLWESNTAYGAIPRRSSSGGLACDFDFDSPVTRSASGRHQPLSGQPIAVGSTFTTLEVGEVVLHYFLNINFLEAGVR